MDANLLRISGVSMDFLRYINFALDVLVLKLSSYRNMDKYQPLLMIVKLNFVAVKCFIFVHNNSNPKIMFMHFLQIMCTIKTHS